MTSRTGRVIIAPLSHDRDNVTVPAEPAPSREAPNTEDTSCPDDGELTGSTPEL